MSLNGDDRERPPRPRMEKKTSTKDKPKPPLSNAMENFGTYANLAVDPFRQGVNAIGDVANFWMNRLPVEQDKGLGDQIFGPLARIEVNRQRGPGRMLGRLLGSKSEELAPPAPKEKSLADFLQEAMAILGPGGGGGVNYDPQRGTLRQNAAENDARLEAMYNQLRGSIDADAPAIQQAYQQAIDATASNSANAQAQTQAAADAAMARNNEVLGNLGIQQAQGNIIQQGTDLNTQAAGDIAAQASKGQAAGDRLVSNQATALQHNTNIGNAAGLEGNLQRAQNQARLQALLADIDMAEQEANRASQQNNFGQQFSLAQALLNEQQYNQSRQDELQMSAAEMLNQQAQAAADQLPDLGTYLQAIGQDANWLRESPQDAARLLDVLRRFNIQQ